MNSNQNEDILSIHEILKLMLKKWKSFIVISILILTLAITYWNFATRLYQSSVVIIPSGDTPQSNTGAILTALGGFTGAPVAQDNSEKIKLFAKSSVVLQKVLERLTPEDLNTLQTFLTSRYLGLKQGSKTPDHRELAFELANFITIQIPDDATSAILISIATPSHKISNHCISFLIEEIRAFHNQNEQQKRQKQEQFFEGESSKYREKMFRNSLNISRLSHLQNAQSGLIEINPKDLDLSHSLKSNIQTTPQAYFEYQSTMQEMYKAFAKSLEQNFQSIKIDMAQKNVLFDVIESPYGSQEPSSPNLLKLLILSVVVIIFIFAFDVFALPILKSILFEKQSR